VIASQKLIGDTVSDYKISDVDILIRPCSVEKEQEVKLDFAWTKRPYYF
jgi:hypothetical protein